MARMTLEEIRTRASTVDRTRVDATTEAKIEAHRAADGNADLDVTDGARTVESPRSLRVRLGMTQPEMAAALSIPLGTWRNWEQGRVTLEPAAAALLRVVSHNAEMALAALAGPERPEVTASAGALDAKVAASEGRDVVEIEGRSIWGLIDRVVAARRGYRLGEVEPPQVQQFAELSRDPKVRAWLVEREQGRAGSSLDG